MKLGKETGSVVNHFMGNNSTKPVVGAGGTFLRWSDRQAFEVMSVTKNGKECVVQQYENIRKDNTGYFSEDQEYDYSKLVDYQQTLVYRYNNWYEKKLDSYTQKYVYDKVNVIFGVKRTYHDPTF